MSVKYEIHEAHDLQYHVHFALSRSPFLFSRQVDFEVNEQDVMLKGTVRTYYQKQMAQEMVRRVHGVRKIVNEIRVEQR